MIQCCKCGVLCSGPPKMLIYDGLICDQCISTKEFIFPFSGLLSFMAQLGYKNKTEVEPKTCSCGWSHSDLSREGRMGCAKCYTVFAMEIAPLLQKFHGATKHNGKIPRDAGGN